MNTAMLASSAFRELVYSLRRAERVSMMTSGSGAVAVATLSQACVDHTSLSHVHFHMCPVEYDCNEQGPACVQAMQKIMAMSKWVIRLENLASLPKG